MAMPDRHGLMSQYQSLGENCEFGYVQAHFGANAIDLLRWVGTTCDGLIKALNADFNGIFQLENLSPMWIGTVVDKRYGFTFHTRIKICKNDCGQLEFSADDEEELRQQHEKDAAKIRYMVKKFLEDLEIGHRIYVFKHDHSISLEKIMAIHCGLRRRHPQKLLCVSTDTLDLSVDEVRLVAPGVKIAAIGRFAIASRTDLADHDGWEVICRTAALGDWS